MNKLIRMQRNKQSFVFVAMVFTSITTADAAIWTTPINGGEVRFDDWGYTGPHGQTAANFSSINGFGGPAEGNALDPYGSVGQIQHVVTRDPDFLTPDAPYHYRQEFSNGDLYLDANADTSVNFYQWGYTTSGGSTFANMRIDVDGDYLVNRNDMRFNMYNSFSYKNEGVNPAAPADGVYPSTIHFQPYALSDAKGWCGSVGGTNPGALEGMAGQIQFDFGFEVFFNWAPKDTNGDYYAGTGNMQIISAFQMRSYGTVTLDVTLAAGAPADIFVQSNAVVNNTNPIISSVNPGTGLKEVGGGGVDGSYYNLVSFMGAGIIPDGIWVLVDSSAGIVTKSTGDLAILADQILSVVDGIETVTPTESIPAGTEWMYHKNTFAKYPFVMRADGIRVIEAMDYAVYPNLTNVPTVISGVAYNNDENAVSNPVADITGTPDAFGFTDISNSTPSILTDSGFVDITGLSRETVISIEGGEYSVNGSAFTSTRSVVVNNSTVQVRVTSSSSADTAVNAVLTVGSFSDTFSVTTSTSTVDSDGDGVIDALDNCLDVGNSDQQDTDSDHYGNACDADFNNDGIVNSLDTGPFKADFFTAGSLKTDLNSDNIVNSLDLGIYKQNVTLAPGPSGLNP